VMSRISLSGAIVNFEIYDASNTRIYQTSRLNISFTGSQSRLFTATWSVPLGQATGTYRLKVAVYGKHWQPLYAWTAAQNTFTVSGIHAATTSTKSARNARSTAKPVAKTGSRAHRSKPPKK